MLGVDVRLCVSKRDLCTGKEKRGNAKRAVFNRLGSIQSFDFKAYLGNLVKGYGEGLYKQSYKGT